MSDEAVPQGRRRRSSSVSFSPTAGVASAPLSPLASPTNAERKPEETNGKPPMVSTDGASSPTPTSANAGTTPGAAAGGTPSRRRSSMIMQMCRTTRKAFYDQFPRSDLPPAVRPAVTARMEQLSTLALGLSFLRAGPGNMKSLIKVDDLFFATKLPLLMATKSSVSMQEMFCILNEYIEVTPQCKGWTAKMQTFDVRRIDNDTSDGSNMDASPRQHAVTVSDLRVELTKDSMSTDRLTLVFYNTATLTNCVATDEDDANDNAAGDSSELVKNDSLLDSMLTDSVQSMKKSSQNRISKTGCAIVTNINPTHLVVQAISGTTNENNEMVVTEVDAPLAAFHTAIASRDETTGRPHGIIVIQRNTQADEEALQGIDTEEANSTMLLHSPNRSFQIAESKQLSLEYDQSLLRFPTSCTPTTTPMLFINRKLAGHVVATALALHLLQRSPDVDVNAIVQNMNLPVHIAAGNTLGIQFAAPYIKSYLEKKELKVGVCPIVRLSTRNGAPSTMSAAELADVLSNFVNLTSKSNQVAIMLCFNSNVAHCSVGVGHYTPYPIHWGVLGGYDAESQMALVIETNPGSFTQYWEVSVDRLLQAMSGNGYVVVSADEDAINELTVESTDPRVAQIRQVMPYVQSDFTRVAAEEALNFQAPMALGAMALSRRGCPTTLDEMLHTAPCNVSYVMSTQLTMEDFARLLNAHNKGKNGVVARCVHLGIDCKLSRKVSSADFDSTIRNLFAAGSQIIVNIARDHIIEAPPVTNSGAFALIVGIDGGSVCLIDCNREAPMRRWWLPMASLFAACEDVCPLSRRYRGYIVVESNEERAAVYKDRPTVDIFRVPTVNMFSVPPCPQLTAVAMVVNARFLNTPISTESIFYSCFQDEDLRDEVRIGTLRNSVDVSSLESIANDYFERKGLGIKASALAVTDVFKSILDIEHAVKGGKHVVVSYNATMLHDVPFDESGAAVVVGISDGIATLADAEPSSWGDYWTRSLEKLVDSCQTEKRGLLIIERK